VSSLSQILKISGQDQKRPGLNDLTKPFMKKEVNWLGVAKNDPSINMWFSGLQAAYPDLRNVALEDFLKQGIQEFSSGAGSGYDYKSAIEMGHRPKITEDYTYHWIGQDPESGYYFKGKEHPTRWMSEQTDPNSPHYKGTNQ
jgi:hypothetical protein